MSSDPVVHLSPDHSETLARLGFRSYGDFLSPPVGEVISEVRDRLVYRLSSRVVGSSFGYYLKVFRNRGANRPLAQMLSGEWPHTCAEIERRRLDWLADRGFAAPRVAAWGARMSMGFAEKDSFLMTQELENLQAMDEWLQSASGSLTGTDFLREKKALLKTIAHLLSQLHAEGFHHPYPYLRHFFVPVFQSEETEDLSEEDLSRNRTVAILDVHSAAISNRPVSRRRRVRGLAELFLSSLKSPLSHSDRLRFLQDYAGGRVDRKLAASVLARFSQKLKRHPNRYRWAMEAVEAMRFPERERG